MSSIVWNILISQIYIDVRGWENCRCTGKLLLNLSNIKFQVRITNDILRLVASLATAHKII